jgi:glycosyltransferase involved in cell wall biosynthesis
VTEKISVVIPVYGVEDFLPACVESVQKQTYSNLEIVLVDDGSPDGCPVLCDMYAKKDARCIVVHKPNGGLSDARNAGIAKASGDWIFLLDSDDWLEQADYLERLLLAAKRFGAGIAVSNTRHTTGPKEPGSFFSPMNEGPFSLSREQALCQLMYGVQFRHSAWGKLYRAELFSGVKYPVGKLYEDLATTYRLFVRCDTVAFDFGIYYGYRIRQGSIIEKPAEPYLLEMGYETWQNVKQLCPAAENAAHTCYVRQAFSVATQNWNTANVPQKTQWLRLLRKESRTVLRDKASPAFFKAELIVFCTLPDVFCWLRDHRK